jgi:hypothetical protein
MGKLHRFSGVLVRLSREPPSDEIDTGWNAGLTLANKDTPLIHKHGLGGYVGNPYDHHLPLAVYIAPPRDANLDGNVGIKVIPDLAF